jgi:hypothetical protein
MDTDEASGRNGFSRPLWQRIAIRSFNRILSSHSVLRGGRDGFVPVMVAVALIASAILLALD